jgi:hypothetical protein
MRLLIKYGRHSAFLDQEQEATITQLKASVMQQQKQIEVLTAAVEKVSDQMELSKLPPQMVADNR